MQTKANAGFEHRADTSPRWMFLDRFPGIGNDALVRLFTVVWRAYIDIAHEHEHAMNLLESEPENDSYRIFEHMARDEVTHAEARMNRLIGALRNAPINSDDDLVAIVTFEAFLGSLAPRNEGFLKWLHQRFEERFRDEIFEAEQPKTSPGTGHRPDDSGPATAQIWGPANKR